MEIILDILFVFIATYTLYFFGLSLRSLNDKPFKLEKRYMQYEEKDNIAVIIYSHNNKKTLKNIVQDFKMQDYPISNFSVYAILDNCSDGSAEIFTDDNFVRVVDLKNQTTLGKDKAISIVLDQLIQNDMIDSFVFIDADREIFQNFLTCVNASLVKSNVITGETLFELENLGPIDKIKAAYQKYHMNFIRKARTLLRLAAQADSGVLIMKSDIIRQIGHVDFKNINTELKYSLLLSKINFRCTYSPNIQTFVDPANYIFRKPRLSYRLSMFKSCIFKIFGSNKTFFEHTLSLLYPNFWFVMISYFLILRYSYSYHFMIEFKYVLLSFLILASGFFISLINSKLNFKELFCLFIYPIYSICHIINNFPPIRTLRNKIRGSEDSEGTEKMVVDVVVNNGKADLNCKLEFISERGLSKIRFIFKNKKYTTQHYLRMVDALQELKIKLEDYGFVLRICSCCSYFQSCVDGSTNMLKGICNNDFPSPNLGEPKQTIIWNTCTSFTPAKLNSLITDMITSGTHEE